MNNLENIVCTLDQSKYFEEHGLFQDSLFVWTEIWENGELEVNIREWETCPSYPAPTAEEILEKLPRELHDKEKDDYNLHIFDRCRIDKRRWRVYYGYGMHTDKYICENQDENITHALADMYIYLHKNKLLTE